MCIVTCEWQDESTCMSICVSVYLLTQCISNSKRIRADSARVDWSEAVQASSVHVPKNWGLVRSRSKNLLDWTWTRLDGSSPDWSIAGLVESLHWTMYPGVHLQWFTNCEPEERCDCEGHNCVGA